MQRHIILGPPGTGKTTTLMRKVEEALARGTAAERIGFVSFSRRAVAVAMERVRLITDAATPNFRTTHATAYHLLELARGDVVQSSHLQDFGQLTGTEFKGMVDDLPNWEGTQGDRCLALYALAKARRTSLEHEWRAAMIGDLPWKLVRDLCAKYDTYKRVNGLLDFSDMIERAEGLLDVDILFVDEAQDTSAAQWALLRRIAAHVPTVYFAGDDDQAVYHWSGADPAQLLRFMGDRVVLPQSYRLPRKIKALADRIANRIQYRVPKPFAARDDEGDIHWVPDVTNIDLHQEGTWLLLARSNYQLQQYVRLARQQGVVYSVSNGPWSWSRPAVQAAIMYERLRKGTTIMASQARTVLSCVPGGERVQVGKKEGVAWVDLFGDMPRDRTWIEALSDMPLKEKEYVRALRRSGESLTKPGRVRIGTVHSSKGAEADHVVLLTDISQRVERGAQVAPDAEYRVQYVGVTRALQSLTLVFPSTRTFWSF